MGLVKRRLGAVKISNIYAWLSISLKAVMVLLFFVVTKPAFEEIFAPLAEIDDQMVQMQITIQRITQTVSGVLGPPLMMIYPILALFLLNKPVVLDHLRIRAAGGDAGISA